MLKLSYCLIIMLNSSRGHSGRDTHQQMRFSRKTGAVAPMARASLMDNVWHAGTYRTYRAVRHIGTELYIGDEEEQWNYQLTPT